MAIKKGDYELSLDLLKKYLDTTKDNSDKKAVKSALYEAFSEGTIRVGFTTSTDYKKYVDKIVKIFDHIYGSEGKSINPIDYIDSVVDSTPESKFTDGDKDYVRYSTYQIFNIFTIGWSSCKKYMGNIGVITSGDEVVGRFSGDVYPNFNSHPEIIN